MKKMIANYPWGVSETMADFLKENPPAEFHPLAYYDKHLDCIRVLVKDCSSVEIRLDKTFTIYEANHAESLEYVGFNIKGIRYFVEKLGLPTHGPLVIAQIIDGIVKDNPDACVELIQKRFSHLLKEQIDVDDLEYALAA
jgi:hypothetical protein